MPWTPNGWYGVLRSDELRKGSVKPLSVLERELVLFRDEAGSVHALAAFCPHYGTHLGHGGRVVGGTIQCPLHGWRFDGSGKCVHVPHVSLIPQARLPRVRVIERSGTIYLWQHARDSEPSYEPPYVPEFEGARDWTRPDVSTIRSRVHISEMRENVCDASHFVTIHGVATPPQIVFTPNGPRATASVPFRHRTIRYMEFGLRCEMFGPGVMLVESWGAISLRLLALSTPMNDGTSELRLVESLRRPLRSRLLGGLLRAFYRLMSRGEVRLEGDIWHHKTHVVRPLFSPHERALSELRAWYAQFYEGAG